MLTQVTLRHLSVSVAFTQRSLSMCVCVMWAREMEGMESEEKNSWSQQQYWEKHLWESSQNNNRSVGDSIMPLYRTYEDESYNNVTSVNHEDTLRILTSSPGFPDGPGGPRGPIGPCQEKRKMWIMWMIWDMSENTDC